MAVASVLLISLVALTSMAGLLGALLWAMDRGARMAADSASRAEERIVESARQLATDNAAQFKVLAETLIEAIRPAPVALDEQAVIQQRLDMENRAWWNEPSFDPTGVGLDPTDGVIEETRDPRLVGYIPNGTDLLSQLQNGPVVAGGMPDLSGETIEWGEGDGT